MCAAVALLWFLTAFLIGATLYIAIRPGLPPPAIGSARDLFDKCRQAGACKKPDTAPPGPPLPADIDRA